VKRGELWALGDHRLLCGDATSADDLDRVLGGKHAAMAFTDPPYGVAYGDHGGRQPGQRRRRIANDALPKDQWQAFVRRWARALVDHVDGAIYVCMSTREWPSVSIALEEQGAHWSDTLIWEKDRFVIGQRDYQTQYEPIWYGWREGAKRHWCGDRSQGNVLKVKRPSSSELHPTMKPLELVEQAIHNSSSTGDSVLDPFLGSGTTIIACERTGRVGYGVEIDPHYASVAVVRWEAFAGRKAECLKRS
jgi:DNA modification methylase